MIIKKCDSFPKRNVIITIYGDPGVGKTSLANTANKPILIDCDKGADRAINRAETILLASSYNDILEEEKEISGHETVCIDTAKALLDDFLMAYVIEKDYTLSRNKLKAYGEIGEEFKSFINRRRNEGLDIVVISHAKQDKDGDQTKIFPDITGQSKDLLMRISDQVGYMYVENKNVVLSFEPTDKYVGKNVAKLPRMVVPASDSAEFENFMSDIISKVKDAIYSQTEEQKQSLLETETIRRQIANISSPDDATDTFNKIMTLTPAQKACLRPLFKEKCDEHAFTYNKESKSFVCTR